MLLYSFSITPNNRKVEAFIKHFDLPVEIRQIDFKHKENKSDEFLALNPMGKVPVLVDGDFALWESNAILTYLARSFPETKAIPDGVQGRAEVDKWLHWQICHFMYAVIDLKNEVEGAVDTMNSMLEVLNGQLVGRDFVLDELSVADFSIGAFALGRLCDGLDYGPFPEVAAWRARLNGMKGFTETRFIPAAERG